MGGPDFGGLGTTAKARAETIAPGLARVRSAPHRAGLAPAPTRQSLGPINSKPATTSDRPPRRLLPERTRGSGPAQIRTGTGV